MIISHRHKFIFVKCGKVAGSSLEMALRPYLGDDDIVTPVIEDSQSDEYQSFGPKNYRNNSQYEKRVNKFGSRGIFYEHAWAYEIKGLVSSKIWDSYYKFAIERDPRDKSLSVYHHNRNGISWPVHRNFINRAQNFLPMAIEFPFPHYSCAKVCSIARWLDEDRRHAFTMNWNRYTVNDEIIVDKVYSYALLERLIADLESIIGSKLELPKLKSMFRPQTKLSKKESLLMDRLLENEIYQKEYDLISKEH